MNDKKKAERNKQKRAEKKVKHKNKIVTEKRRYSLEIKAMETGEWRKQKDTHYKHLFPRYFTSLEEVDTFQKNIRKAIERGSMIPGMRVVMTGNGEEIRLIDTTPVEVIEKKEANSVTPEDMKKAADAVQVELRQDPTNQTV
jgi:hypothetical protein